MSATGKQFVVSVADAFLVDKSNGSMALKAKTLLSSAITQSVQNTEIRGGDNNKLLFDWCYQKDLQATLEDARWSQEYIAINNGTSIVNGLDSFYVFDEIVQLTSGDGTVAQTPIGDVFVEKADGSFVTVTPSGSDITVAGGGDTKVKVVYQYSTSIDKITITTDDFPQAYELVLKSKIFNQDGTKKADLEIVIPQYKPMGNYDITFGAADASTSRLEGKALAYENDSGQEVYAYVNIRPVSNSTSFVAIAATPADVTLDSGETQQLTVYGIRGGVFGNMNITAAATGTTYESDNTGVATVSVGGLITYVAAGDCVITVENGDLSDVVNVTCNA